jgi:hypothetical protein
VAVSALGFQKFSTQVEAATDTPPKVVEAPVTIDQSINDTANKESTLIVKSKSGQSHTFLIEIVDTPESRRIGLMHRTEMAKNAGMLFVFGDVKERAFWMRNTFLPLDIIYIDENLMINHIHENAVPLDETPLPSLGPVQYVLEVNAGITKALGISKGDFITIEN